LPSTDNHAAAEYSANLPEPREMRPVANGCRPLSAHADLRRLAKGARHTNEKARQSAGFFVHPSSNYAYRLSCSENCASGAMPDDSARWHQSCRRASSCSEDSVERSHSDAKSWRIA
jgi:hypothetical protein